MVRDYYISRGGDGSRYLECPVSFCTGATSFGDSPSSVRKVKSSGTLYMKAYGISLMLSPSFGISPTFPSSDPDAISESLKGLLYAHSAPKIFGPNKVRATNLYPRQQRYDPETMAIGPVTAPSH